MKVNVKHSCPSNLLHCSFTSLFSLQVVLVRCSCFIYGGTVNIKQRKVILLLKACISSAPLRSVVKLFPVEHLCPQSLQ